MCKGRVGGAVEEAYDARELSELSAARRNPVCPRPRCCRARQAREVWLLFNPMSVNPLTPLGLHSRLGGENDLNLEADMCASVQRNGGRVHKCFAVPPRLLPSGQCHGGCLPFQHAGGARGRHGKRKERNNRSPAPRAVRWGRKSIFYLHDDCYCARRVVSRFIACRMQFAAASWLAFVCPG